MSAYEGSKMQENDQDRKHGFLCHVKDAKEGKKEVKREEDLLEKVIRDIWFRANILTIEEFKGWLKGEGYAISRIEP